MKYREGAIDFLPYETGIEFDFRYGLLDEFWADPYTLQHLSEMPSSDARFRLLHRFVLQGALQEDLGSVQASKVLNQVTVLKVYASPIAHGFLETFSKTDRLSHLRELHLGDDFTPYSKEERRIDLGDLLGDSDVICFAQSGAFPELTHLDLSNHMVGNIGVSALANSSMLCNLQVLDLSDNPIGDEGISALAKSNTLNSIHTLGLRGIKIRPKFLPELASTFPSLRAISLQCSKLGLRGFRELAKGNCQNLQHLYLGGNKCGAKPITEFLTTSSSENITTLDLRACRIKGEDLHRILDAKEFANLENLFLDKNSLGEAGAKTIASSEACQRLKLLSLSQTKLNEQAIQALASSPNLSQLASLDLSFNPIGDRGIQRLLETDNLPSLKRLDLFDTKISDNIKLQVLKRFNLGS